MKRLVLALAPLFLLASLDRLGPATGRPPAPALAATWNDAAPWLPAVEEGREERPLKLVFLGSSGALRETLTAAGWTEMPRTLRGCLAQSAEELLKGERLLSWPPMRDARLKGRRQDMNWARSETPPGRRRSFRLWRTGIFDLRGRSYWWGSAALDDDRDFALETLRNIPQVEAIVLTPLPQIPREGTDGRVGVLVLKPRPEEFIRRPGGASAEPSAGTREPRAPCPPPRSTPTP